jgi:adenosylmethionine-8-amino-7-oxononanoate aminotransferase
MTRVQWPEGHVLLRNLTRSYPVIAHGEGIWLVDVDGRRWLDGASGAFVAGLGHGRSDIAQAMADQAGRVGYVNGTQFTSTPTEALAAALCAHAPAGLDRAFFLSSGSEAVEAAVKFVRQVQVERGELERTRMLTRTPSYHGNTLYALSLSGRPHYRTMYGPMLSDAEVLRSPYPYRPAVPGGDDEAQVAWHVRELEETIARVGAHRIAGFIAEPVVGSSAGAAVPPPGYFPAMVEVCRRHEILVIADEILCGFGRTGYRFACEAVHFEPDVLVMGKALGGGVAPLSAVLVKTAHVELMRRGTGSFLHAQTYLQMPAITAAGLAAVRCLEDEGLVDNARVQGGRLGRLLQERILPIPGVGSVQGIGLLWGVELVADRSTKAPFARSRKVAERVTQTLFDEGLIVWPNVGQADGHSGDLLMVGPPLVIDADGVDTLIDRLEAGLRAFFAREE